MKNNYHNYSSIQKVGENVFLIKAHTIPSFLGKNKVNISIELTNENSGHNSWKRSVTVPQSDVDTMINDLIASYFEEIGFFRITHT
jgi:hypothetical protein